MYPRGHAGAAAAGQPLRRAAGRPPGDQLPRQREKPKEQ